MKTTLKLKRTLALAILASSVASAADDLTLVFTGGTGQMHESSTWIDAATGENYAAGSGASAWTSTNDNHMLVFTTEADFLDDYPDETFGSDKDIVYTMGNTYFGGVTVEEGAMGYSISASGSQNRNFTMLAAPGKTSAYFEINEDFVWNTSNSFNSNHARNLSLGSVDAEMIVASDKTFTIHATLAGGAGRNLNLSGGGTLDFNYNNGTRPVQANFDWNISGFGTTLDVASIESAQLNTALGTGSINLADGSALSVGADASFATQLNVAETGGVIDAAGDAAATVTATNVSIAQGAGLRISAGDSLANAAARITGVDSAVGYRLTSNGVSSGSITDTTLSNLNLDGAMINVLDGAALTLNNVTISNTTDINLGVGSSVVVEDSVLTGLTVASSGTVDFTSIEGVPKTGVTAYTISGIETLLGGVKATGSLTLDLSGLTGFVAPTSGDDMVAFILEDVAALSEILTTDWYGNIIITVDGYSTMALGSVMENGNVMLYIPEPSTATLSLLALAGLLARRRRKTA